LDFHGFSAGNNAFAQDRYREKLFALSEQGKRRAIVAFLNSKKRNSRLKEELHGSNQIY
jgi:hypothetical protein